MIHQDIGRRAPRQRPVGMGVSAILSLLSLAGAPALADGIVLAVQDGPGGGEVTLNWTGGPPSYTIFPSTRPMGGASSSNDLGQTSTMSWSDIPPQRGIFFYSGTRTRCRD